MVFCIMMLFFFNIIYTSEAAASTTPLTNYPINNSTFCSGFGCQNNAYCTVWTTNPLTLHTCNCLGGTSGSYCEYFTGSVLKCKTFGCQYQATCRLKSSSSGESLHACFCTAGFTAGNTYCQYSILPIHDASIQSWKQKKKRTFEEAFQWAQTINLAFRDQQFNKYSNISESAVCMSSMMQTISQVVYKEAEYEDYSDVETILNDYFIPLCSDIQEIAQKHYCIIPTTGCLTPTQTKAAILESETSVINTVKTLLKIKWTIGIHTQTHQNISITYVKDYSYGIGKYIETPFGGFQVPFWETLQQKYNSKKIGLLIFAYMSNPYIFARSCTVNTATVNVHMYESNMKEINLPDPNDPFTVRLGIDSSVNENDFNWDDMVLEKDGYMASSFINGSINALIFEVEYTTLETCSLYGRRDVTIPTPENFQFMVTTKGFNKVIKYRPFDLLYTFLGKILRITFRIPSTGETRPFVFWTTCEDDAYLISPRRYRIKEIDLKTFDSVKGCWIDDPKMKLTTTGGNQIAFQSNFFGTFSADMLFVAPDVIDFSAIFDNFSARLEDTPHVLVILISVLLLAIPLTLVFRRKDVSDSLLWSYLPLLDNDPGDTLVYNVAVSTSITSIKNITCQPCFNIIGKNGETGGRVLSDGVRKNFGRGTLSLFKVTTSVDLGDITWIELWHDNHGKAARWLPNYLLVEDLQQFKRYVVTCDEWLATDKGQGRTCLKLEAVSKETIDSQILLKELGKRHLFDDHLWFSLIHRPNCSQFTRVQRLWSLIALLYLAMVTSAMFFDTPDDGKNSLKAGPIKLTYKQLYVGLVSSLIIIIPNIIVVAIFRKRRLRQESKNNSTREEDLKIKISGTVPCLPWWTVFIAYSLVGISILTAGFFLFFYSLEWGRELTEEWLIAIALATVQSAFIIEPSKALIITIIIAFCCSKSAQNVLTNLPRVSASPKYYSPSTQTAITCPIAPSFPEEDRVEQKKRLLKGKVGREIRQFLLYAAYSSIVLFVCSQIAVENSFRQNNYVKNALNASFKCRRLDDIYSHVFNQISFLFPISHYNGDIRSSYEKRFTNETFFRLGPLRLRQKRIKGQCNVPSEMRSTITYCSQPFSFKYEDKASYGLSWQPFNESAYDLNEADHRAFVYTKTEESQVGFPLSEAHVYDGGGYIIDLGPKASLAKNYLDILWNLTWLDGYTRAVFCECVIYQANSNLFSHLRVVYDIHSFGDIDMNVHVTSVNLYPYRSSFDYIVLGLQILIVGVVFVRVVFLVLNVVRLRKRYVLTLECFLRICEVVTAIAAIIFYALRVAKTIQAIENVFENIGFFVSFDDVILMGSCYNITMAILSFIIMLDLLKPLSFNFHLHLMRVSLALYKKSALSFTFMLTMLMTSFSSLLFLTRGNIEVEFCSLPRAALTLLRMSIGMVSMGKDIEVEHIYTVIYVCLYAFFVTLIVMNLFISGLNMAFSEAELLSAVPGDNFFDHELPQYLWWRVKYFLGIKDKFKPSLLPPYGHNSIENGKTPTGISPHFKAINDGYLELQETVCFYQGSSELQETLAKLESFFQKRLSTASITLEEILYMQPLRCVSRCIRGEQMFMYKSEFKTFELFMVMDEDPSLPEEITINAIKMNRAYDIIPINSTGTLISPLYRVSTFGELPEVSVTIKIVFEPLYLRSDCRIDLYYNSNLTDPWLTEEVNFVEEGHAMEATLPKVPFQFALIRHDPWKDLPYPEHKINIASAGEGYKLHGSPVTFFAQAIESNRRACITYQVEPSNQPFPCSDIIHLCSDRDLDGFFLINFNLPSTLQVGFKKLKALVQCGVRPWKIAYLEQSSKENHNFKVCLKHMHKREKIKVLIKSSEDSMIQVKQENKAIATMLHDIQNSCHLANSWHLVGSTLGVSDQYMCQISSNIARDGKELLSFVLETWYSTAVHMPSYVMKQNLLKVQQLIHK